MLLEYSGGTDDGVSGVWENDRGDAWKVCEGDICVWRWMSGKRYRLTYI